MRKNTWLIVAAVLLWFAGFVATVDAAPIIVRAESAGVAQVLRVQTGAYGGQARSSARPGYHFGHDRIYWADSYNGGYTLFWLDPTLSGDVTGSHDSKTGRTQHWSTGGQLYAGTVTGNTKTSFSYNQYGFAYLPDSQSMLNKGGTGNTTPFHEVQAAKSDSGDDVVDEGTSGDPVNSARKLSQASPTLTTGDYHQGLALYDQDATDYYMLFIDNRGGTSQNLCHFKLSRAYATDPTATTYGTRTLSNVIEPLIASATANGLVPGHDDILQDLANDESGQIWALSTLNGTNYITAFTIAGSTLTQVDLDPDDDNGVGSMYVQLGGLVTQADGTTAQNGHGITVNGAGTRIYIAADGGGTVSDSIFIFDLTVPDIRSIAPAANIDTNDVDMVGYLAANDATVWCYWGTNDGVTTASAWMSNTLMGAQSAPVYITNSIGDLIKGTAYHYRYFASNTAGTAWATNSTKFVTLGVDTSAEIDNYGADPVGATTARLHGEVLGGDPDPNVWIYWGTTEGDTNNPSATWNLPVIDKGPLALGLFQHDVSGLLANQTYWYRCFASNVNNVAWAPLATNFTTDPPSLSIDNVSLLEGPGSTTTAAVFTVTLSATSVVSVSVNYTTVDGSATTGDNDYQTTSGLLTIPANTISKTITVTVNGDSTFEADESFDLNLSVPSNATIADGTGTATIENDDYTFYVRGDGSGNDANSGSSWANAFATLQKGLDSVVPGSATITWTVNVQASTGAQTYDVGARNTAGTSLHLYLNIEGGWENVDAVPAQTGYSRIQDDDGVIDERGLTFISSSCCFNQNKSIAVNRFSITNVTDGVYVNVPNNIASLLSLTISNSMITATADGIELYYPRSELATLTANQVTVRAGLGGPGHGVVIEGDFDGSLIEDSSITTAGGDGIRLNLRAKLFGGGYPGDQTLVVRRTTISDCDGYGINLPSIEEPPNGGGPTILLDSARLTGNGTGGTGDGVRLEVDQNDGYPATRIMRVRGTNSIIAANADAGINLQGAADARAAKFLVELMNCTVADNGDDGVYGISIETSGNSVFASNSIFANNGDDGIEADDQSLDGPVITEDYNDFFGNTGSAIVRTGTGGTTTPALGGNDLTVNPSFIGAGEDEPYRPSYGNAVLDGGDAANHPTVDIVGIARPQGAGPSMGAYETGPEPGRGTLIQVR